MNNIHNSPTATQWTFNITHLLSHTDLICIDHVLFFLLQKWFLLSSPWDQKQWQQKNPRSLHTHTHELKLPMQSFILFLWILVERLILKWALSAFTMATIALFSASEQTSCALVVWDSEWVTVALRSMALSIEVVTALFGCYMAGAMWNCCHLHSSSVYTIWPCTSFQCQMHIV